MCLVLLAINIHPRFPLIILSNRDEFYQRTSTAASFWQDNPEVFAGIDLTKGGTWLGVNQRRGFSLITNFRSPQLYEPGKQSRGFLVKDFLIQSKLAPLDYLNIIQPKANDYNLFNLIVGDSQSIYYYSNINNRIKKLTQGLYGLSNALLDAPWYKITRAKKLFNQLSPQLLNCNDAEQLKDLLFPILTDKQFAPDRTLPETGINKEMEHLLSSIFVDVPEYQYGTNASSVVIFDRTNILFSEQRFTNGLLVASHTCNISSFDRAKYK